MGPWAHRPSNSWCAINCNKWNTSVTQCRIHLCVLLCVCYTLYKYEYSLKDCLINCISIYHSNRSADQMGSSWEEEEPMARRARGCRSAPVAYLHVPRRLRALPERASGRRTAPAYARAHPRPQAALRTVCSGGRCSRSLFLCCPHWYICKRFRSTSTLQQLFRCSSSWKNGYCRMKTIDFWLNVKLTIFH